MSVLVYDHDFMKSDIKNANWSLVLIEIVPQISKKYSQSISLYG
jgi:hypothetical protein